MVTISEERLGEKREREEGGTGGDTRIDSSNANQTERERERESVILG